MIYRHLAGLGKMCVRSGIKNLIIYSFSIQQHVCVLWTNAKKMFNWNSFASLPESLCYIYKCLIQIIQPSPSPEPETLKNYF